jgi:hypothetical protein
MGLDAKIFSQDTVSFFIDGRPYQVDKSSASYEEVLDELRKPVPDEERLIELTKPALAIQRAVEATEESSPDYLPKGVFQVTSNSVSYNGEPVHGVLVERILQLLHEGFDFMPMVRFMENLYLNPADFARDELYLWLETSQLPITEDGYFLAYKNVNGDFTSIHDGKTKNDVGTIVSMPRTAVDDNRNRTCSQGLHFCSPSYLPNFSHGRDNTTVLLKINPADVVSIPSDYNNAKGRAWKYEVLSVVDHDPQAHQWAAVVDATGDEYDPDEDDGYDEWEESVWEDFDVDDYSPESEARAVAGAEEIARPITDPLKRAQADRINSLGIIALRREASKAGFQGAWKGPKAETLKDFLISRL